MLQTTDESDIGEITSEMTKEQLDGVWNNVLKKGTGSFKEPSSRRTRDFLAGDGSFAGVQLKNGSTEIIKSVCGFAHKFRIAILARLQERFPPDDMELLRAFEVFSPQKIPADRSQLAGYGDDEIKLLCAHYGTPKQVDGKTFAAKIDSEQLCVEWENFKYIIHKHRHMDMRSMYRHLIQKGLVSNQISVLVDIRLVQAMNTACCERGFSRMKLIKTASRNRLYVETLDALMMIALNGPSFDDTVAVSEIVDAAFEHWSADCKRNPNKARFGNKHASKTKTAHKSRRLVSGIEVAAEGTEETSIDELADECEDSSDAAGDVTDNSGTAGDENSEFDEMAGAPELVVPSGFIISNPPTQVSNKALKLKKIVHKCLDGWLIGTFRHKYTGNLEQHKGQFVVYYNSFLKHITMMS